MSEAAPSKTKDLLKKAEAQHDSATPESSSVAGATRVFSSIGAAKKAFSRFHEKLLHIAEWNAHSELSGFELFDRSGAARGEKPFAAVGDFIRVTLPGSGKDDWVTIAEIHCSPDEIVLTVQPSSDPTNREDAPTTSHFFTRASSNNFCLHKENSTINFYVIGLDEQTNTAETGGILETVRNYATANIGCFLGVQKKQWETFCENFLEVRSVRCEVRS